MLQTIGIEKEEVHSLHQEPIRYDNDSSDTEEFEGRKQSNITSFLNLKNEQEAIDSATRIHQISGLQDKLEILIKGSLLANFPKSVLDQKHFNKADEDVVGNEKNHPWRQNFTLYFLAFSSACSAAVQGMDESAVGGAALFYTKYYGIDGDSSYFANLQGIVNAIPYLAAAVVGCWLAIPSNYYFGRRVTIFWASFIAAISGIWQAFSPSWQMLLVGRLIMGISIGTKSATVPVYTAESAPAAIRGGLVMLWQTLTAFGVMWGFIMGVAFLDSGKDNWRYMLGSIFPLPLIVCLMMFFIPESPRWLIQKGRYVEAYESFKKLRTSELIAARDFYYTFSLIEIENEATRGSTWYSQYIELFTVPRNRSALLASWIVMFGQQFCGVNVLTFYISTVLVSAGFSNRDALSGSVGFGALAVTGAITAIPLIDRKGRRFLLLATLPVMVVFLLWVAFSFYGETSKERLGLILSGIYVYVYFYGIGMGPVPFTYNAESASITVRDAHSSFGTATTWMFSFILGFTLPNMQRSIGNVGVFCFYAGWCVALFILILLFVPETKGYTLEELDLIFQIPIKKHAEYQIRQSKRFLRKLFKKDVEQENLIEVALRYEKKDFIS